VREREREREYIQCSNHGGDKHPMEGARQRSKSHSKFHNVKAFFSLRERERERER
jgi:hypothetical protein